MMHSDANQYGDFLYDNDAEPDLRWLELVDAAGLILPSFRQFFRRARAIRMMQMYRLRALEWEGSREKPYFVQEFVNGIDE